VKHDEEEQIRRRALRRYLERQGHEQGFFTLVPTPVKDGIDIAIEVMKEMKR
jgi:hypothetical protein